MIEPIESEIEESWAAAREGPSQFDPPPPEVRRELEELARQHWIAWIDLPVPALNNMTPREATKTEEGRDLLESLLLYFESTTNEVDDDVFRPDVAALRCELGM